jgi:hypothetical protein
LISRKEKKTLTSKARFTNEAEKNRLKLYWLYIAIFSFASFCGLAQVSNNGIANRILLEMNSDWYASSTRNANVEWDCVNKALTNKCLVYHNDQWFSIKPISTGTYFVNIRNQYCKNLQGVQLVVIEGDPCKTDSYQLVRCIDYTEQSDIFVRLEDLQGGKEYLINIDGYLNDQCDFEIQFSDRYNGIPATAKVIEHSQLKAFSNDSLVDIRFTLADSLAFRINNLILVRKNVKEKRSMLIAESSLRKNALGVSENNFSWRDTLRDKGDYIYSVLGVKIDDVLLLGRQHIVYKGKSVLYRSHIREITYYSKRTGNVLVHILDHLGERRLYSSTRNVTEGKNSIRINFSEYVQKGIYEFNVVISDKGTREEYKVTFAPGKN